MLDESSGGRDAVLMVNGQKSYLACKRVSSGSGGGTG